MAPQRKSTFKVNSDQVQGKGSWVELSFISYSEFQAVLSDTTMPDALLQEHVLDWNWVDDDGEPLGKPGDTMHDLYAHERKFLLDCLYSPEEHALKNSGSG